MSSSQLEEEEEEEVEEVEEEEEIEYVEVSEEEEEEDQNPNPNRKRKPSVPESITHLQFLHGALSDFLLHYNSLHQTLDSINSSLDSVSTIKTPTNSSLNAVKTPEPEASLPVVERQDSEVESLCRSNAPKALRKYISTHLSEIDRLRREIPEALKLAFVPEKLVLEAMGKFYLQGCKAYENGDSNAINCRRAGILLLEFYLIAGCPVASASSQSNKRGAMDAAISWRKRIISEGGIESASAVDALGLVLLVAAFGVPVEFKAKELYTLLRLCNLTQNGDVLCRSTILVQKVQDIIKHLIAKRMLVEAVDLVCTFGLEEIFPPLPLLVLLVKRTCEVGVEERIETQSQSSLKSLKEANEKRVAALRSVVKCLEYHKLESTQFAGLKIDENIAKCEQRILKCQQKLQDMNNKRKLDKGPLRKQDNQVKQLKPSSAEAAHGPLLPSVRLTQEQGISPVLGSKYDYNGSVATDKSVSAKASHGLQARNLYGSAGVWHGTAVYQSPVGQSFGGSPYSSGHDYARYSTAAGQNYQSTLSVQNLHQATASGQNYQPPTSSVQNLHQSTASGQNYQPPVSGQNLISGQHFHQPIASGQNIHQPTELGQNLHPLASAQNLTSGTNLHQPTASGKNLTQSPTSGKDHHSGQNLHQPTASGQNVHQPTASVQNLHQQTSPGQNLYQQTASVQNLRQPAVSGQNYYQPIAENYEKYCQPSVANYYQKTTDNYYQPNAQYYYQPTVAGQNYYQPTSSEQPAPSLVTEDGKLHQLVNAVQGSELSNYYTNGNTAPDYSVGCNAVSTNNTVSNPIHQYTG